MTDTYQDILKRTLQLRDEQPERFRRFYDKVWLMLLKLPEGGTIHIDRCCTPQSQQLFQDIAALTIMEQKTNIWGGNLEFLDENLTIIRRTVTAGKKKRL